MKTIGLYTVVISGMLSLAGSPQASLAAQRVETQDLQTNKKMEEFVAKASTPAEHAQLSKHFKDMAAKYRADADVHAAMAASYRRNPGPPRGGGDPGAHCDLLARRTRAAADTAAEIAKLHEGMKTEAPNASAASVTHASMPMAEPRFPDLLPAKQALALLATAKTPADHARLGKHFAAESASYTADADRHAAMAAGFRGNPRSTYASAAVHCDRLVQRTRDAATAARELAKYHEGLADKPVK